MSGDECAFVARECTCLVEEGGFLVYGHMHAAGSPASVGVQVVPVGQTIPQAPQLFGSLPVKSTQVAGLPGHAVSAPVHVRRHGRFPGQL